jgi:hypothetical protein
MSELIPRFDPAENRRLAMPARSGQHNLNRSSCAGSFGSAAANLQQPLALEFAFQVTFVNYWRAKVEKLTQGLVASKIPSVQQAADPGSQATSKVQTDWAGAGKSI